MSLRELSEHSGDRSPVNRGGKSPSIAFGTGTSVNGGSKTPFNVDNNKANKSGIKVLTKSRHGGSSRGLLEKVEDDVETLVAAAVAAVTPKQQHVGHTVRSSFLALSPNPQQVLDSSATGRVNKARSASMIGSKSVTALPVITTPTSSPSPQLNTRKSMITPSTTSKVPDPAILAAKQALAAAMIGGTSKPPLARPQTASAAGATPSATATASGVNNAKGVGVRASISLDIPPAGGGAKARKRGGESIDTSLQNSLYEDSKEDNMSIMSESTVSTIGLFIDIAKKERPQSADNSFDSFAFSELNNNEEEVEDGDISRGIIKSPRSKYIAGCMKQQLNPRASLVVRKNMSKQLNLQHHGMGDTMAKLLAESIQGLPFVESINIADNMLTDDGMGPIILAAVGIKSLIELNLSQNEIGPGGITLGVSILKNTTLETLILTSNSLDSIACFTICAGVIENRGLKKVVLDGNPIGEQGMKALMLVPMIAGNRVKISAARCNVSIRDSKCWFDFVKLIREYPLNMDNGFERAIAIILLHIIAGHHSYVFSEFTHITPGKGKQPPKSRHIDLIQVANSERSLYFDAKQKKVLKSLQKVKDAASDIRMAIQLFQETDEDGSGELDKQELGNLMTRMGLQMSDKRLSEVMDKFDVDQGGKIEIHEFLMLLKSQHQEAIARIKELIEAPVMALKTDKMKNRYLPPETGKLNIKASGLVMDGFARKEMYRIMSSCDKDYIDEVAKDIGGGSNSTNMISSSLQGTKLRLDEGLAVAHGMLQDSPDKVAIIKKMITQKMA
eukprot:gene28670-35569_t